MSKKILKIHLQHFLKSKNQDRDVLITGLRAT